MSWTDAKIKKLKELWEKGLSTSEIGKKLNMSKNAVVGKAHRIGLKSRPSPIKSQTASNKKKNKNEKSDKPSKENKKETKTKKSSKKEEKENKITIEELGPKMCRWPFGDPRGEDFSFCGEPVFRNKPYCLKHCAMAYTTTTTKKKNDYTDEIDNSNKKK
jgi:GcrA cell cycle regulator